MFFSRCIAEAAVVLPQVGNSTVGNRHLISLTGRDRGSLTVALWFVASSPQHLNLEINIFRDSVIPEEDMDHFSFINNGATPPTCVFIHAFPSLDICLFKPARTKFWSALDERRLMDHRQPGNHLCPMHIKRNVNLPKLPQHISVYPLQEDRGWLDNLGPSLWIQQGHVNEELCWSEEQAGTLQKGNFTLPSCTWKNLNIIIFISFG